ncbi:Protein CBG26748 [Caenorhabditis briggsae]|uniref:Protein CBG26748 n=1 Tax=Caenorhabditis briggsae TaxID=6238 RepID=B6IEC3_CAEBR|nr:Protein CBG26748 [Caenorhabditis briggsae]CAS01187.1 Protein CBG26748 [Caenorhabditis briggsae]
MIFRHLKNSRNALKFENKNLEGNNEISKKIGKNTENATWKNFVSKYPKNFEIKILWYIRKTHN